MKHRNLNNYNLSREFVHRRGCLLVPSESRVRQRERWSWYVKGWSHGDRRSRHGAFASAVVTTAIGGGDFPSADDVAGGSGLVGLAIWVPHVRHLTPLGVVECHALDRVIGPRQLTSVYGGFESREHLDVGLFQLRIIGAAGLFHLSHMT